MQLVRVGAVFFYMFLINSFFTRHFGEMIPSFDEFEFSTGLVPWRVWQWKTWTPFEDVFPVGSIGQFQSSYFSCMVLVYLSTIYH